MVRINLSLVLLALSAVLGLGGALVLKSTLGQGWPAAKAAPGIDAPGAPHPEAQRHQLPPIDAAPVPPAVQTATFALG